MERQTLAELATALRSGEISSRQLTEASLGVQVNAAIADSLGLCLFGRSVTDANHQLIIDALRPHAQELGIAG